MYIAIMESENFSWIAIETEEEQAKQVILNRWNRRQLQAQQSMKEFLGFEPKFYETVEEMENDYSILCKKINPGQCEVW